MAPTALLPGTRDASVELLQAAVVGSVAILAGTLIPFLWVGIPTALWIRAHVLGWASHRRTVELSWALPLALATYAGFGLRWLASPLLGETPGPASHLLVPLALATVAFAWVALGLPLAKQAATQAATSEVREDRYLILYSLWVLVLPLLGIVGSTASPGGPLDAFALQLVLPALALLLVGTSLAVAEGAKRLGIAPRAGIALWLALVLYVPSLYLAVPWG